MTVAADLQAVTFGLGEEVFALPVAMVREILDHRGASRIPNAPAWLLGLTDVRGQAVPTIDFRLRLGLPAVESTPATRILVIEAPVGDRTLALALMVDRVMDVCQFAAAAIEPAPDIGVRWSSDHIAGVVRTGAGFVMLLSAASIFAQDAAMLAHDLPRAA